MGNLAELIEKPHVIVTLEEGVDDREFLYPYYRVQEAGLNVVVIGTGKGKYKSKLGLELKEDASAEEYLKQNPDLKNLKGLVIPGGKAPERLRINQWARELVRKVNEKGIIIASICHGPQLLISAGVISGRRATSYITVADDVKNAGAQYLDESVVVDGNLITSRHPGDIPNWMREFIKAIS